MIIFTWGNDILNYLVTISPMIDDLADFKVPGL